MVGFRFISRIDNMHRHYARIHELSDILNDFIKTKL